MGEFVLVIVFAVFIGWSAESTLYNTIRERYDIAVFWATILGLNAIAFVGVAFFMGAI